MPLRQFLYCDDELMDDFLAELEGGQSEEERQRDQSTKGGKFGGKVGASGVGVEAGRDRGEVRELERTVRQVRASKFDRLYRLLSDERDPLLREVDELDDELWAQLQRSDLISIDASIGVPAMARLFGDPGGLDALPALARMAGEELDSGMEEALAGISQLGQLSGGSEQTTVVGEAVVAPEYRFLCRLRKRFILNSLDDLEGEAVLIGKIQRKLRPQDRELLVEFPGMSIMDRKQRREFLREQERNADSPAELFMEGPAAVVSVLAIFR